jgi:hypothetical protein
MERILGAFVLLGCVLTSAAAAASRASHIGRTRSDSRASTSRPYDFTIGVSYVEQARGWVGPIVTMLLH